MNKFSIWQKNTILNLYISNQIASKYVKQKLIELQRKICKFTIIVKNVIIFFSIMYRTKTLKL